MPKKAEVGRSAGFRLTAVAVVLLTLPPVILSAAPPVASPSPAVSPSPPRAAGSNPLAGKKLYVDPNSVAKRQAETWKKSRPADAALIGAIADKPVAKWLGGWVGDIRREVDQAVSTMTRSGAMPVFVAYNIPARDCGQHSAGGAAGADAYRKWMGDFATGLAGRNAIVIVEPDGLAGMDCLPLPAREERTRLIRDAVRSLKAQRAAVYIDAGNSKWIEPPEMAKRLDAAGVALADGFALNVSNVHATESNVAYGEKLSKLVGDKHFIIDTSRNGVGSAGASDWCNPRGRALGTAPTTNTGHPLIDAFLWVKPPGESDGTCGGGPVAGEWWSTYALELSRMAATLSGVLR